jgi:catechol 2,3-dioxygenase-like lactoylglutathione lyase family enzyme
MTDLKIHGFNHTSFTVEDVDRSVTFFCEALGFELMNKAPRGQEAVQHISGVEGADIVVAFIQGPGHRLELIEYVGPADRGANTALPCDTAFAHIALDVNDVDAALAKVVPYGIEPYATPWIIDQGPNTGNRVVYTKTWDGITIEFIEKK